MTRKMVRETRRIAKVSGLGVTVFLLTSLISARAQQPSATPAVQSMVATKGTSTAVGPSDVLTSPANDYTVSPEDLLEVYVMDVPEVTRTYRVSSNGLLTLPLLPDPIPAAGETLINSRT